ncbi:MAG: hypothetical protein VYE77_11145 [Planctomycetota bacterium]|nr:hypothetical protein [Planctomycetota bacterium]
MELPTLARPEWLCSLFLLLRLLWWLARPPRPRRRILTAHREQWLRALAALRRRPPRLRPLRLWLLVSAVVAIALAAAAPKLAAGPGPDRLLVLLDASASMAARSGDGTAQSGALRAIREQLAEVPTHVRVEVVELGAGGLRRLRGPVARKLADPMPPQGALPAPLAELVRVGAAQQQTVVWTVTDGQHDGALPADGAITCTGETATNAAVLAVACADRWPLPELDLTVDMQWFADRPASGVLRVEGAIEPVEPMRVELAADQRARAQLSVRRLPAGGPLRVLLGVDGDALAADDLWQAELPPLPAPRIAVLSDDRGGPYVRAAAAALAEEVGGDVVAAEAGRGAGFLLIEGGRAELAPGSSPFLAFGVARPGEEPELWPEPVVVDWDREDPLMAGLDWSELQVAHALAEALPDGRPLLMGRGVAGERQPLAVLVEGPRASSVHFAFRIQDSNLGLLPVFPQLLRRALLRGYGDGRLIEERSPRVLAAEADLRGLAVASRPLPDFGRAARELGSWCALLALGLLALRAWIR